MPMRVRRVLRWLSLQIHRDRQRSKSDSGVEDEDEEESEKTVETLLLKDVDDDTYSRDSVMHRKKTLLLERAKAVTAMASSATRFTITLKIRMLKKLKSSKTKTLHESS